MLDTAEAKRETFWEIPNAADGKFWWHLPGLRRLNLLLSCVYLGMMLNAYDGSLNSGFQAQSSWKAALGHPSASAIGLLNASAYVAGLFTMPVAAYLGDRFGRRWCIIYSACANLVGTAIGAAADAAPGTGYAMFITSRIIIGTGVSFALCISPIMLQECPHPRQRTIMASFFDCSYNIGSFIAAWVVFGCSKAFTNNWSWRIPYLLHVPWAILMIIVVVQLPESPRWLMAHDREEEAIDFIVRYHGEGNANDPLVKFELAEIRSALEKERTAHQETWSEIFGQRGNRHRLGVAILIACCQNLSGTGIIAYYYSSILALVGITDTATVTGINAGLVTFTFIAAITGLWCTQVIRRRTQFAISWTGTLAANVDLIVATSQYAKTRSPAAGIATVFFVWVYNAMFWLACGSLFFTIPVEVQSFSMRAKGMMIWGMTNKSLNIFSQYTNPVAMARIGYRWFIFYTAMIVFLGILIYFYLPETKGLTLEEMALLFDGANKVKTAPTEVEALEFFNDSDSEKKAALDHKVVPVV